MAGQWRGTGRGRWAGQLLAVLLLVPACSSPGEPGGSAARDVQRTLDRRAAAVVDRDEAAYLAPVDPRADGLRVAERREFANLAQVPLRSWAYRLTGFDRTGEGRATARVELSYRLDGYDSAAVKATEELDLTRRDGRWYVAAESPGKAEGGRYGGAARQLWEQGRVTAVRGTHSLVLGVGQSERRLREIANAADRAVPAVDRAWQGRWARRLVLLVPSSVGGMASLLGGRAAGYRGIAAVTTGEAGGSGTAPADRVIVNPDAYAVLGAFGQQIVLAHESAHVATRAHTSAATPMWLSEGFADWVAYRGTGRTADEAAPELARAVRGRDLPAALPTDQAFGFGGDADALARAYEGGWLACRLIAEERGEKRLTAFYRAVGGHAQREGAVEKAMQEQLGTTPEDFTVRWRAYLRERLG
ncbi:hypothetical protein [Streptomyces sp. H27-C3]|uniref:hypothetical protein n=1 Tax=Streptomyces sp. H27-C3 TaxID=3046305 RepID=UPI0024BBCEE5|nr:hypothetical protein [Streptomyces sp. H27-C3]MDJ0461361.1 hypothetical protein [Streptomyces sp. H27-C3]